MTISNRTIGAAVAVTILAATTIATRLHDGLDRARTSARRTPAPPLFCAGVQERTAEPGLVCAAGRASFLTEAVRAGFAPSSCAAATLPEGVTVGSLVVVDARGPACAVVEVRRLPAATALICGARLEINRATEAELALLPGIGEVRARRIVESRVRDGPFPDVESLDRVHGIGPKTVEALRSWIAAGAAP